MLERIRKHEYWSLLFAQVLLLFVTVISAHHIALKLLFILALFGVLGTTIRLIWESFWPRVLSLVFALTGIAGGVIGHAIIGTAASMNFARIPGEPIDFMFVVACLAYSGFILIAMLSIARHVLLKDRVTGNAIAGGICVYMLIGMFFGFLYLAMALVSPGMFDVLGKTAGQISLRDYFAFSYCTLTTVGSSNTVITHPLGQLVAALEAVAGNIYLAIIIAGLVGSRLSAQRQNRSL